MLSLVGITAVAAAVGAVSKWTLPIGRSKRDVLDHDREVQTLLACVNVLIGLVQQRSRRVLFIVDGLDRIRDIERAKALFVDSQMIAGLACSMVVGGPFALRHHPSTAAIRGFNRVSILVNEPVLLQSDPTQHGPGVHFFCDLFDKRVADLRAPDLISARTHVADLAALAREGARRSKHRVLSRSERDRQTRAAEHSLRTLFDAADAGLPTPPAEKGDQGE